MKTAKIFLRRNGSFGAGFPGILQDTGHHIIEDSGRFTVLSIKDGETPIATNATRAEAEKAIGEDWMTN